MKDKINIRAVAAAAGVSPATASRVLNGNPRVDPSLTEKELSPKEQAEIIQETFFAERKRFLNTLREMETERSISLHVGCCDLCGIGNCARISGKPCRHPKEKRFSMESLGADAIKAADRYFGVPLCWPEKGRLPAYFMLVCGMLRMKD